jgi:aspartyl-tRNA synthetase
MQRIFIGKLHESIDQEVTIAGFIGGKRSHGKVVFLDLRDNTGKIQSVSTINQDFFNTANEAGEQSAYTATGTVVKRPEKLVTAEPNGDIELQLTSFTVVNPAKEFPWGMQASDEVNEELRMQYRYLDMRSERVQRNLKLRSNVVHFMRNYLHDRDFNEVETPYITKGTPEGAREFLIPSRQQVGKFYALPQSPQQFKQLLMVGGMDRYFSVARCFRDEDPRGDRQPEFTQLDVEMSYITEEDIYSLIEPMYIELVKTLTPEKHISQTPFPRLTYTEAMETYGTDKPDLRKDKNDPNELAFCWIVDWPLFEYSETDKKLVASHHLFTRPKAGQEALLDSAPEKVLAEAYDIVLNGYEVGGGSVRIHEAALQQKIFSILGISEEDQQKRFGHMLEAFQFGAPPHGGIAPGIDRLIMILANEPNIREVIAFPKTGDGRDLLMDAPSDVTAAQLKDLHIKISE